MRYLPKPTSTADIVKPLQEGKVDIPEIPDEDRMTVQHMEWEYIQRTLGEHGGPILWPLPHALKMHRRTLQRKLAQKRPSETPPT